MSAEKAPLSGPPDEAEVTNPRSRPVCQRCDIDQRCLHGKIVWWEAAGRKELRCPCVCHTISSNCSDRAR
jgi:hypothetical protein